MKHWIALPWPYNIYFALHEYELNLKETRKGNPAGIFVFDCSQLFWINYFLKFTPFLLDHSLIPRLQYFL